MRYLSTFILIFLTGTFLYAQNDPKAKEILDKAAAKFKTYPAVEVDFKLTMENKAENIHEEHQGKAYMKKNLYKLELMNAENYYDGKNIYTYMPDVQEVNIKNPNDDEEEMLNPATMFDIHNQGFTQKLIRTTDGIAYIELTPLKKDKNYTKIGVWVNPVSSSIQKVTTFGKDGNNVIITIDKIQKPVTIPDDSFFKFDTQKHPDVEVIDLR